MKRGSGRFGWFLLVLLLLVLFIASIITDNETVRKYRDNVRNKADALRYNIINQEGLVNRIRMELYNLRHQQGYFTKKAKKICTAVKCTGLILFVSIAVMVHAIFSLNPVEFVITFCTMCTLIYGAITGIILNEVRSINEVLRLLQEAIIQRTFEWHNFQPDMIEVLEKKLFTEEQKLNSMKAQYINLNNSN